MIFKIQNFCEKKIPLYPPLEEFKFLLRKDYSRSPRSLVVQSSRPAIERPGLESQRRVERDFFSQKF